MNEPTHLDLFSGIGGFAIAAAWAGFRTVGFCEIDPYCQAVLKSRFGSVMANANEGRLRRARSQGQVGHAAQCGEALANRISAGLEERQEQPARQEQQTIERGGDAIWNSKRAPKDVRSEESESRGAIGEPSLWQPEPEVGRVAHGIPRRVDRLKGLGNAIVPQVAFEILKTIRSLI